jgi:hypothetical protein
MSFEVRTVDQYIVKINEDKFIKVITKKAFMSDMNMAGAFVRPKGSTRNSNKP